MTRKTLLLAAFILCLSIAGGTVALNRTAAEQIVVEYAGDEIEYNTVYDCGTSKSKFKVLSCKGTGKFDRCEVFYINELSPGGGHKVSTYRSSVESDIDQGCKTKNAPAVSETQREIRSQGNTKPVRNAALAAVACSASSDDSDGRTANEKNFRGVIRRLWEKEASEGSDGAVTVTFENLIVGGSRPWRPTATDAYSQADPRKPIYSVRASFETCTDYRSAISKRKMERIYDCFVHKTGGWQCTQTGASGALALKDKKEYIQKKR